MSEETPKKHPPIGISSNGSGRQAVTRADGIDPDAAKVVRRLTSHGHEAYLVGGCVRDLLLERTPKDFDVATSATPNEIKKLFRNSRIIGRRFRLAHIFFGRKVIETSTFRALPLPATEDASGEELIIRQDNEFGTAREDALRRDFTVNGLFLDLRAHRIIDHVGGIKDLKARRLHTIGDPEIRLQEDPVRSLRAIKFAARLGFRISKETEAAIVRHRGLIAKCSVARVLEEIYRLLGSGHAWQAVEMMQRTGVLGVLLPELETVLPPPPPISEELVMPIQDRSGLPRAEENEPSPPSPRHAPPETPLEQPADDPSEVARCREETRQLMHSLCGSDPDDLQLAAASVQQHLVGLDQLVQSLDAPPPHALLLAGLFAGAATRVLSADFPIGESIPLLERFVREMGLRLRVSRKDRDLLKQILTAQRRMVHRGKRRRPGALASKEYFPDALALFQISCEASGENQEILARWQQQATPRKPKRNRRRRRPRRKHQA